MPIVQPNTDPTVSTHAAVVSPSNTVDLTNPTKGIYVGGAGDLKVNMFGGDTVTFVAVPAKTYLPICVTRVFLTGTGATKIVALWE